MTASEGVGPGGRLFEIATGDDRAVISESGATLRSYEVAGRPVVEAFAGPDTEPVGCPGQILAPWPNRVVDGRWRWGSTDLQLDRWWQVFTGHDLPEPYRRRTLAVEPMTCAPDALNSGDGLVVLQPRERHTLTWGVRTGRSPLPGAADM